MRGAIVCAVLVAAASAALAGATPQKSESERKDDGVTVTMRGCVAGSLLKSALIDTDSGAGVGAASDRYRLIGSKPIKAQIKKANKALVQITGRVKPGPQPVVKGTTMGGTSVGIGVAPGSASMDQQAQPYTPTLEVETIEIIAKEC
jgi:hypothetical protein